MSQPNRYRLVHDDVLSFLRDEPSDSYDAMLTDPPYGLEFMGRDWDRVVPGPEVWAECLRVLKPGAYALVFGGTRTWHRLAVALEDAGFDLKDTLMWVHSQGFPKSHDVSKAIDKAAGAERPVVGRYQRPDGSKPRETEGGRSATPFVAYTGEGDAQVTAPATPEAQRWQGYGSALKPAWEPVLLVRKPTALTYAQVATEHGCGALNIDGCRVPIEEGDAAVGGAKSANGRGEAVNYGAGGYDGEVSVNTTGRWPANLIHDGSDEAVAPLAKAARYFYAAKANRRERDAGLDDFPLQAVGMMEDDNYPIKTGSGNLRNTQRRNPHPTVKPISLTEYLARLLLPPGEGTLLVPFAGVGSEMIGALYAGWDSVVGIEREAEYVAIGEKRLSHWLAELDKVAA